MTVGTGPRMRRAAVSALTGEGLDELMSMIDQALAEGGIEAEVSLDPEAGADLAWAYANGDVLSRRDDADGGITLRVGIASAALPKFERRYGERLSKL